MLSKLFCEQYRDSIGQLLDAYWQSFDYHCKLVSPGSTSSIFRGNDSRILGSWKRHLHTSPRSFLHWAAEQDCADYVQQKVVACPKLILPDGELSLLLSAALSLPLETCRTLKGLLGVGASPRDRVGVRGIGERALAVWQIFCVFFATAMLYEGRDPSIAVYCKKLQYLLEAGVDSDCCILLAEDKEGDDLATHIISLKSLVEQLNPPNLKELSALLRKNERGRLNMSRSHLVGTGTRNWNTTSLRPHFSYIPYKIDMELAQPEIDWLAEYWKCTNGFAFRFYFHSIQVGNTVVDVRSIVVRTC